MVRSPWLRLGLGILFIAPPFALQGFVWRGVPTLGLMATAALSALLSSVGGGAAYRLFVRCVERRAATELGGPGATAEAGLGMAIGSILCAATIGTLALCGAYRVVGTHPPRAMLVPLFVAIGAGVIEEILFRGLLFRLVELALGSWLALAISSACFGFAHLTNPGATVQGAVAIAFEAGLLLGASYLLTRRLWLAIGLHAAWNFTQSGIFGVPTSGVPLQGLLIGELHGPAWLAGGGFGAEASIVALALCTVAGLALLEIARRRGQLITAPWRRRETAAAAARGH